MKISAASSGSQEAGLAGHHRARHQPHVRSARLVQARPPLGPEFKRPQLVCLERHRPEISGHADHLHRYREIELDLGSGSRPVLLAPLLLAPARPHFAIRGGERGAGDEARARHTASTASVSTPSLSLERDGKKREPARDDSSQGLRAIDAYQARCCGEDNQCRRMGSIWAAATNAIWLTPAMPAYTWRSRRNAFDHDILVRRPTFQQLSMGDVPAQSCELDAEMVTDAAR